MRQLVILICASFWIAVTAPPAAALDIDGITLGAGPANDEIDMYRMSLRRKFKRSWFETDFGRLTGVWDLSLGYWDGANSEVSLLSLSPVFRYLPNAQPLGVQWFLDGGVGATFTSDTQIDGRDLSTNFQFEDQIGIGGILGEQQNFEFSYRFMHYSNANLDTPNDGVDIHMFHLVYWFGDDN